MPVFVCVWIMRGGDDHNVCVRVLWLLLRTLLHPRHVLVAALYTYMSHTLSSFFPSQDGSLSTNERFSICIRLPWIC